MTRSGYQPIAIRAARRLLVQLAYDLQDHLDEIVVVGGMACGLLFPHAAEAHAGTIDIDLALDPARLPADAEDGLEDILMAGLYQQDVPRTYRWTRTVPLDEASVSVKVDLLVCEYDGSTQVRQQTREIQGVRASVLRGIDLAFIHPHTTPIEGLLLDGRPHHASIRICNAASLLMMKGIAAAQRLTGAEKDASDIDYILRWHPGGPATLAQALNSVYYAENPLVIEGLRGLAAVFSSPDALGPRSAVDEERFPEREDQEIERQQAFQRVRRFLHAIDFSWE